MGGTICVHWNFQQLIVKCTECINKININELARWKDVYLFSFKLNAKRKRNIGKVQIPTQYVMLFCSGPVQCSSCKLRRLVLWVGTPGCWNCGKKCPNFNFRHTSSSKDYRRKYQPLLLVAIFLSTKNRCVKKRNAAVNTTYFFSIKPITSI